MITRFQKLLCKSFYKLPYKMLLFLLLVFFHRLCLQIVHTFLQDLNFLTFFRQVVYFKNAFKEHYTKFILQNHYRKQLQVIRKQLRYRYILMRDAVEDIQWYSPHPGFSKNLRIPSVPHIKLQRILSTLAYTLYLQRTTIALIIMIRK